jgi:cytochrome c-type biogenesis protein CcmH/NrfF
VDILLWLVPSVVVTALAMCWVAWAGRTTRGEVDREVATRRMQQALQHQRPRRYAAPTPERDRSTGVAVRPSRRAS